MDIVSKYYDYLVTAQTPPGERQFLKEILARKDGFFQRGEFDVVEHLQSIHKPVVEVAGPTPDGYDLLDIQKIKIFHTNIAAPGQRAESNTEASGWRKHVGSSGDISVQMDGQRMPFSDKSIGGILMKAIVQDVQMNDKILSEAHRVLHDDGLLILEQNSPHIISKALELGFSVVKAKIDLSTILRPYWCVVLKK